MGQNGKIWKSRDKNELKFGETAGFIKEQINSPVIKAETKSSVMPNYNFKAEVAKDAGSENRLLWAEIIIVGGIVLFAVIRHFVLSAY